MNTLTQLENGLCTAKVGATGEGLSQTDSLQPTPERRTLRSLAATETLL